MKIECRSVVAFGMLALAAVWPAAAPANFTTSVAAPASVGQDAVCFNDASGAALCGLSADCDLLTACTQNSDCAPGEACAVNTCCDTPSPNVCVTTTPGFTCDATGPFSCGDPGNSFFPPCALVAAPAPALSTLPLAGGALLLAAIGLAALRARRRPD